MPERTIDWGAGNSPYETHVDRNDNGRVVLAEDTTGGTVLLEYDESANSGAGGWISRGPVDLSSNDLSGVGALTASSVRTDELLNDLLEGDDPDLAATLNSRMPTLVGTHDYGETGGRMEISPTTTYEIAEAIEYEDGVRIVGNDRRSTEIKAEASFADSRMFDVTPANNSWFGGMEHVRLDGNRNNATTKGIYFSAADGGEPKDQQFPHLFLRDIENQALHFDGAGWGARIPHLLVEGCGSGTNYAVHFVDQQQIHIPAEPFIAYNKSDWAVYFEETGTTTLQTTVNGWWIYQNDFDGLKNEFSKVTFSDLQLVANGQDSANVHHNMELAATANDCTITNSIFAGGGGQTRDGLRIAANNCMVSNCVFASHGNRDILVTGDNNTLASIDGDGKIEISGTDNRLRDVNVVTITDNGTRTRLNGRYLNPPTFDLGGGTSTLSPTNTGPGDDHYRLRVESAGGTGTLNGVDNITTDGKKLVLQSFGSNNINLAHNSTGASSDFRLNNGNNQQLNSGDMIEFVWSQDADRWVQTSIVV